LPTRYSRRLGCDFWNEALEWSRDHVSCLAAELAHPCPARARYLLIKLGKLGLTRIPSRERADQRPGREYHVQIGITSGSMIIFDHKHISFTVILLWVASCRERVSASTDGLQQATCHCPRPPDLAAEVDCAS